MAKVSILIIFLTVFAQLHGQGGNGGNGNWGRYAFPKQTMSRIGTFSRPLLSAPSRMISTSETPLRDLTTPISTPSSSLQPNYPKFDFAAMRRRTAEIESLINGSEFPGSKNQVQIPIQELTPSSSLSPSPSKRYSDPPPNTPGPASSPAPFMFKFRQSSLPPTYDSPSPYSFPISESPPRTAQPPSPLPSSSYKMQRPGSSLTDNSPSPPPPSTVKPPPASCSASSANATPPVSQYRKPPSLERNPTMKNDFEVEPNKSEAYSPSSPPQRKPSTPLKRMYSMGNDPSRKDYGSSDTQRFGGSTVVSENLPNGTDKIEIKISGRQIDDDRMMQMIKEAKNAITAVFYAPLHTTREEGRIITKERPQPSLMEF